MNRFYVPIRIVILVLPPALIGVTGAAYLYQAADRLFAPGRPVQFRIPTRKGDLIVSAQSYNFDAKRGLLIAIRPQIVEPGGKVLGNAESVFVKDLYQVGKLAMVEVRRPVIHLRRDNKGGFPQLDLLPDQKGEPSKVGYQVKVFEPIVFFEDPDDRGKWSAKATAPEVVIEGQGDRWLARADLAVEGIGRAKVRASRLADQDSEPVFKLEFSTANLRLTELWEHLRRTRDLADIPDARAVQARSLTARGQGWLEVVGKKVAWNTEKLVAHAEGVGYKGELLAQVIDLTGLLGHQGFEGNLKATNGAELGVDARGKVRWDGAQPEALATWKGQLGRIEALPALVRKQIPNELAVNGTEAKGIFKAGKGVWQVETDLVAKRVAWTGEQATDAVASGVVSSSGWRLDLSEANYRGAKVKGSVGAIKDSLVGWISAPQAKLENLLPKGTGVSGTLNADVLIGGKLSKPSLSWRAAGPIKVLRKKVAFAGPFTATGILEGNVLKVESASLAPGAESLVSVSGSYDLKTKRVSGESSGVGIPLSRLYTNLGGSGAWKLQFGGVWPKVAADGTAEVYGPQFEKNRLAAAVGKFHLDKDGIEFSRIRAIKGSGSVDGKASLRFADGRLFGDFAANGIEIGSWLPDTGISGVVSSKRVLVGGTVSKPRFNAKLEANQIVSRNFRIQSATSEAEFKDGVFRFVDGNAKVGAGRVTFRGFYGLNRKRGALDIKAEDVLIGPQFHDDFQAVTWRSTLTAEAKLEFSDKLERLTGQGSVGDLEVNGVPIGGGDFEAKLEKGIWSGSGLVGNLQRYLSLQNVKYNPADSTAAGSAELYGLPVKELVSLNRSQVEKLDEKWKNALAQSEGKLGALLEFSGKVSDPDFTLKNATLMEAKLEGNPIGTLNADVNKKGERFSFNKVDWKLGDAQATLTGVADRKGDLNLDGEITGFPLEILASIEPRLGAFRGKLDVSLSAAGKTASPEFRASLRTTQLGVGGSNDFALLLDSISLNEKEGLRAEGELSYRGIPAALEFAAPVQYPFTIPASAEVQARVKIADRSLSSLSEFLPGLDPKGTDGVLKGELKIGGRPDALKLSGGLTLQANKLAVQGADFGFRDVLMQLGVVDQKISVNLEAKSTQGGTASVEANVPIADLTDAISGTAEGGLSTLLNLPVTGTGKFQQFKVGQSSPLFGKFLGEVSGETRIEGPLKAPKVTGTFQVSGLDLTFAPTQQPTPSNAVPTIDPVFDILVTMPKAGSVKAGIANLDVTGVTTLSGTLSQPDLTGSYILDRGSLRFPAARVNLTPQGMLALKYRGASGFGNDQGLARLDVNLEGRTRVVTTGSDIPERYSVDLGINGNLLEEGGLRLTATSDPAGLDQARILALIGQGGLLDSLKGDRNVGVNQEKLRQTLTSFLPAALEGFTGQIATSLGLDFLSLEYNPLEQATFSFGRYLNSRWYFEFRRQLTLAQNNPGQRLFYDVRLLYLTPFKGKGFRRLNFILGADQDRPWKVGLEYRLRF